MQVVKEELKYQQAVLKHLGFYKAKVDGIWSEASIAAKSQFEFDRSFSPAIPNNGLPFGVTDRLPKGMFFKRKDNRMVISHAGITDEEMERMVGNVKQTVAVREPTVSNDGPLIEAPVEEPVSAQITEHTIQQDSIPKPVAAPQPQRPQQHGQHKPHQQGNRR